VNPNITYHIRFPDRVTLLSATSSSRWTPPPLPSHASARSLSSGANRPTVSIIRGT
jgi:hypothetical protein